MDAQTVPVPPSLILQQSSNEEPASTPSENALKKRGRPFKSVVTAAPTSETIHETENSKAQDGGEYVPMSADSTVAPADGTRRSGRSRKATLSYQEQLESDGEQPVVKRQKKRNVTYDDDDHQEPSNRIVPPAEPATPKKKRAPSSSPRKAAIPKAKGVKVRTEYTSDPSAVFIEPLVADASSDSMVGFTRNGSGQLAYHGEPNEGDSKIKWWLNPRINPYTGKYMMVPPALTQKKWRAYCAFRKLDTSGKAAEMQERLRDYIKAKEAQVYSESSSSSEGFVVHLVMAPQVSTSQREWQQRNEAEKTKLWEALPIEQRLQADILGVLKETVLAKNPVQDVWNFKICLKVPTKKWLEVSEALECSDIGFIFTTYPQLPDGRPADTIYQRGIIDGVPWLSDEASDLKDRKFLGGTWAGSGFEKGIIFGRTRALVKQKVEEMCEQIEYEIFKGYVKKIRDSEREGRDIPPQRHSPALSDDTTSSQSEEDWTEEEEEIAQAAWDYDESKKRTLNLDTYTYRLGELCSFMVKDPFVDDGQYTYYSDGEFVDNAPYT
ncbi:uncharacterized protein EAE98_000422 [Botrytis deweyae]|uniref:SAP domain-containing protein n=1 Tax=Botrytis deweyae TaxID=2478750 RepID=A0ABQ7J2N6_9HELO|nr:uncharacterized protein EAE98_000422 [Botrytis deweyae]KAF7940295.1 hypothetical protein EAE98_000422 [Botrytis deweyae]